MMGELRHRTPGAPAVAHDHDADAARGTTNAGVCHPPSSPTRRGVRIIQAHANGASNMTSRCNPVAARVVVMSVFLVLVGLQVLVIDIATTTTTTSVALIGGGGADGLVAEARPFVVTNPDGLAVRRQPADRPDPDPDPDSTSSSSSSEGLVGTLPFGSIVLLADWPSSYMYRYWPMMYRWASAHLAWLSLLKSRHVSSSLPPPDTTTIMRMVYPYEEGYVDVHGSAKPLVGTMGEENDEQILEVPCRDNSWRVDNVTWQDYRSGTYNAEGDSPQWTIQYQPASAKDDASPWMAPTWLDQVPIGTGRDGALVGSTASASVIPVSAAGLFVPPAVARKAGGSDVSANGAGAKDPPASAQTTATQKSMPDDGRLFAAAREALLRGDHGEANRLIGQLQAESSRENPFSSLEYAADLIVAFAAHPLQFRQDGIDRGEDAMPLQAQRRLKRATSAETVADRIRRKRGASKGATTGARKRKGRPRDASARDALIENLLSTIEATGTHLAAFDGTEDRQATTAPSPLHPYLERGQLDFKRGLYRENFVVAAYSRDSTDNSATPQRQLHANAPSLNNTRLHGQMLHHREYFAALEGHIIASRLQCHEMPSSSDLGDESESGSSRRRRQTLSSCLNIAIALSRTDADKSSVSSRAWSDLMSANQSKKEEVNKNENIVENSTDEGVRMRRKFSRLGAQKNSHWPQRKYTSMRGALGVSIRSNSGASSGTAAPDAEVCGVLTCRGDENMTMSVTKDGKAICSSSSSAEIILAVELQSKGNDIKSDDVIARSAHKMKLDCQKRLLLALEVGYDTLKERHVNKFSKIMAEMDFRLTEKEGREGSTHQTCDGRASSVGHSTNLSRGRKESTSVSLEEISSLSPSLLRRHFQFSRYLMLSAAASSVPNLQFWVDGPVSAWSGE